MDKATMLADPQLRPLYLAGMKFRADLAGIAWYDSWFLNQFETAKRLLKLFRPAELDRFVSAFEVLRTRKDFEIQHMSPVFDAGTFARIREVVMALPEGVLERHETNSFGRNIVHDHPYFTELQAELTDKVSDLAGEVVTPGYNFLSLYSGSGVCRPHMDDPKAKWTLDICLDQSVGWPIHFSQVVDWPEGPPPPGWKSDSVVTDPALDFTTQVLEPNKAVLFAGSSQWHYRNPIPDVTESYCNLLFFHYFPKGAEALVDPSQWAAHFDLPELEILELVFPEDRKNA